MMQEGRGEKIQLVMGNISASKVKRKRNQTSLEN